ncbi:MAG: sigma E protease regulator RseP [Gammaproteobacteria bacterium]|nr:sigma E protease regulator RseP [Gammaproteobacteria bacterium]
MLFTFLWNLGSFIIALGLLVAVHEFGHFWVARRCGVIVERFSIGFGKALWRKTGKDGTEYVIAAIPLGGYVKMLDERVDDVPEDQLDGAFNRKSIFQRIAIVAAGPIANFIFAIFAFWLMYLIGVNTVKPVIGEITSDSIAEIAEFKLGEKFQRVDGLEIKEWQDVNLALIGALGNDVIEVTVVKPPSTHPINKTLKITDWQFNPEQENALVSLGIKPYYPPIKMVLGAVSKDSAAQSSGLLVGDELLTVNGQEIGQWQNFVKIVKRSSGTSLTIGYRRGGNTYSTQLTPLARTNSDGTVSGFAGISPTMEAWPEDMKLTLHYGPIDALVLAVDKTGQLISLSFKMIGKLLTGDLSVKNLSGPISIAKGAGQSADYGIVAFLSFLALISVNLGIINLLPLPVLDGGHLMYYFIELLTGKPVPERIQNVGFQIGAILLFMLMSIAIFNDFTRL